MLPYKQMADDDSPTEETPGRQTVVMPTVVVSPGPQTTNPVRALTLPDSKDPRLDIDPKRKYRIDIYLTSILCSLLSGAMTSWHSNACSVTGLQWWWGWWWWCWWWGWGWGWGLGGEGSGWGMGDGGWGGWGGGGGAGGVGGTCQRWIRVNRMLNKQSNFQWFDTL